MSSSDSFDEQLTLDNPVPGVFERELGQRWWGWNGQFGGYVLALALQACRDHLGPSDQTERSLTLHFMRRFGDGRCRIEVVTERAGRTVTNFGLHLYVDDVLSGTGLALFGSDRDAEELLPLEVPTLVPPPPDEAPQPSDIPAEAMNNFDVWPRHEGAMLSGVAVSEVGGWMRLREPGTADERFLVMVADGYLPVSMLRSTEPSIGGTLDFTAHFLRPVPESVRSGAEPVRVIMRTDQSAFGYTPEDCSVWSADGQLLMRSHQVRYSQRADLTMLDPSTSSTP